jgi:hypothetical protein
MILFYVDEAGNPGPHNEPLFDGQTPLFCLSAVAVDAARWRDLDRSLLALKRTYYAQEMRRFAADTPGMRSEHFEVKGNYLLKPSNAKLYRNRVFTSKVLEVLTDYGARLFAAVWRKHCNRPNAPDSIYNHSLQVLAERFHYHCSAVGQRGIMIIDSRTKGLDFGVAAGHLSFLFGHPLGRTYTTLVEAPLFVNSQLSAGVQFADIVGSCIYGHYYRHRCHGIAGHYAGLDPLSAKRFALTPPANRAVKVPARDYTHADRHWSQVEALQFKRTDVAPPAAGVVVPGYFGFRELGD